MTNPIATIEADVSGQLALSPRELIEGATEQATVLMEIVKSRKLFATIQGKMYLEAEAWEVICAFNNVAPDVVYVNPIVEDGKVVAYEAKVNLIDRNGALRGSGIAECGLESFPTRGREGRDKDKAAKSAAQTWAISKAARMAFSWVAVLAGFEPTPATEMRAEESTTDYGICPKHDVPYFKRGAMTSPGHKDETTNNKWCNRPNDETEFQTGRQSEAPESPAEPVTEPNRGMHPDEAIEGTHVESPRESDGGPAEEGGTPSYGTTKPDSSGGSFITPPRESDGGPPLFPPEQASKSPEAKPHITNMVGLLRVLKKDFRLGKEDLPKIETILKRAGMKPLAESTNLQAVYDEIDRDFAQAEAAYREEQTQPIANTEA